MISIEVNGTQVEEESEIREQVVQFYTSLYQENEAWCPDANGLPFEVIGVEEQQVLERRFEKDEILQVIKDLQRDKALRLDGYTMAVFSALLASYSGGHHGVF